MWLLKLFYLNYILVLITPLPNGSPLCESDAEKTSGCMGGDNTESFKYNVSCGDCKVTAGGKLTLKVSALVPYYHGLLLYVQGETDKDRVGSFTYDTKTFKDNEKRCKRFNYQKDSVITHKDNSEKSSNTEFEWLAPNPCPKSMTIRATFIYNQLSKWMVIKPVEISCTAAKSQTDYPTIISNPYAGYRNFNSTESSIL